MICSSAVRSICVAAAVLLVFFLVSGAETRKHGAAAAERVAGSKPAGTELKAAKREFSQKFRSKHAEDRAAALGRLAGVPGRDTAELVWQHGLTDSAPEVRTAAIALLAGWRDESQVATTLLDLLKKETRKSGMGPRAYAVLKALGGTQNEERRRDLVAYLDEFLATPRGNQRLIHELADELGLQGDADSFQTLKMLAEARYFKKNFGYRRCVLQGIVRVPGDDTITDVIDRLPDLKGQVQFDVIRHLVRVTGENFKDDAESWKAWWLEQDKKLPKKKKAEPRGPYGSSGYYGIPIGAKRVLFALDVSGSMGERGKIDAAKKELCDVIRDLPKEVYFGIVAFHSVAVSWQEELMPANEQNQQQAIRMVMSQQPRGSTASYDALETAMGLDPEAIFFVSDGAPRAGKIVKPEEIVAAISQVNYVRRVSIHAIGIGTNDPSAAELGKFMRSLADANWGEFREVAP